MFSGCARPQDSCLLSSLRRISTWVAPGFGGAECPPQKALSRSSAKRGVQDPWGTPEPLQRGSHPLSGVPSLHLGTLRPLALGASRSWAHLCPGLTRRGIKRLFSPICGDFFLLDSRTPRPCEFRFHALSCPSVVMPGTALRPRGKCLVWPPPALAAKSAWRVRGGRSPVSRSGRYGVQQRPGAWASGLEAVTGTRHDAGQPVPRGWASGFRPGPLQESPCGWAP